jgi:hypothetical protein
VVSLRAPRTPTGGTWTLAVGGQTTAGIPYNATATAVRSAIEALSSVGAGNVIVTGGSGGPWTVAFSGVSGKSGLTGGTCPSVTVTTA